MTQRSENSEPAAIPHYNAFRSLIIHSAVLIVFIHLFVIDRSTCRASGIQNTDGSITVTASIDTGADDAVEKTATGFTQLNYKYVYPGKSWMLGFRFNDVDVPADATILSAKLLQYSSGYEDRSVRLRYVGQASPEPEPFTGNDYDLSMRPRTASDIIDTPATWPRYDFLSSPDLAPIIQEIVDDPQWRTGATLVLFAEDDGSEGFRKVDHYEYDPAHAARIEITYLPSAAEPVDTFPPEIHILIPAADFRTDRSAVDLSGTAGDDSSIQRIEWQNDAGDSGSAGGTEAWSISNVPLHEGTNIITVEAFDPAGNKSETSVTVYRLPAPSERQLIKIAVGEGADDSLERTYNDLNNPANTAILIGKGYRTAFRFPGAPIPPGSLVTRATLLLHCYSGETRDIHIRYRGEASASSAPFSPATGDIGARPRTLAEVSEYTPDWARDAANDSPDLKEIVQEIIAQSGWRSGNALSLFLEDIDSSSYRYAASFEYNPAQAAALEIEYVPLLGSEAIVSAEPNRVKIDEAVAFHAEFTDPTKILSFLWHFGDEDTSGELNPVHDYAAAGSYTARFEFTDIYSNQFYETVAVTVDSDTTEAIISAQPTQVKVDETVAFHAEFTDPTQILTFLWRFGDGETSGDLNPTHAYAASGSYTARFEFTDIYNNQLYETVTVQVDPVAQDRAFEGFGATTTGGEGFPTQVAGSPAEFSDILSSVRAAGGNAIIRLEGNWTYSGNISLTHLSNLTIDGMNASITFDGTSFYLIDCENIILQGLRIRKHQIGDDCLQINSCRSVVIDHCSFSEAGDGNLDITGWSYGPSRDITVSWCILANTWKQSLVKYSVTTNISFHHNLFFNGGGRFPHLAEGVFDIRNNVMYQWESYGLVMTTGARVNIINNCFTVSPSSSRGHAAIWYYDAPSAAWLSGNLVPAAENDVSRLSGPMSVPIVSTQSAQEAKDLVLNQAGAMPRDAYDQSVIQMVRNNVFPPYPPHHD
ncbi:MAG: PKD domain-containing protein [Desulfobacteraceae bacterium]|nr:MAG: PKD domain-containing protein [Desulfobacteraceae bacterium]